MSVQTIVSSPNIVCFVGGAPLADTAISTVIDEVSLFIGVDRGADHLLMAGVKPAAVIGDLDSLSEQARATFAAVLCQIDEQSTTDFEKALSCVASPAVLCLGFTGGRIDHVLSVLNVMARNLDRAIILADESDVCFVARIGKTSFSIPSQTRVSIMPLGPAVVTVTGLEWPFANQLMTPADFTSPSNASLGGEVTVDTDGPVLLTLPRAFLQTALTAAVREG